MEEDRHIRIEGPAVCPVCSINGNPDIAAWERSDGSVLCEAGHVNHPMDPDIIPLIKALCVGDLGFRVKSSKDLASQTALVNYIQPEDMKTIVCLSHDGGAGHGFGLPQEIKLTYCCRDFKRINQSDFGLDYKPHLMIPAGIDFACRTLVENGFRLVEMRIEESFLKFVKGEQLKSGWQLGTEAELTWGQKPEGPSVWPLVIERTPKPILVNPLP